MDKKVVRIIREHDDGSKEFIEGNYLENFLINESIANDMALCGRVRYYPVTWKKEE